MCIEYPIFRELRQFFLNVTLTSEVLPFSHTFRIFSYAHRRLFLYIDFTRYLVDTYLLCVSGLDWTGFSFWVIS